MKKLLNYWASDSLGTRAYEQWAYTWNSDGGITQVGQGQVVGVIDKKRWKGTLNCLDIDA